MIHTLKEARILEYLLQRTFDEHAQIIGSLSKGKKSSKHDIDILLPSLKYSKPLHRKLKRYLQAKSSEQTDWNGIFFHKTIFGNVDVFFSTKNFTY